MIIKAVIEYNNNGYLAYSSNYIGAFGRGMTEAEAISKLKRDVHIYDAWARNTCIEYDGVDEVIISQKCFSDVNVADADSIVLFDSEKRFMLPNEYKKLKLRALRSAEDFMRLYASIPDKNYPLAPKRQTFYGDYPRTAEAMYTHTANVNSYYFGEIGIDAKNLDDMRKSREEGFLRLEASGDYLENLAKVGEGNEVWTLAKLLRRFIWHDRIHARAMYRRAVMVWGRGVGIDNTFGFEM